MYEETDKKMNINWPSLILKLVLLVLIVLLVFWLIKVVNKNNGTTTVASTEYTTNINDMKAAGFEYFTGDNLPSKVGNTNKLTLEEMINQKLLVDFTNNGKTCNLGSSYIQATKTSDNNYAMKVALDCDSKNDYIVTTIDQSTLAACEAAQKAGETCASGVKALEEKVDTLSQKVNTGSSSSSTKSSSTSSKTTNVTTTTGTTSGSNNYGTTPKASSTTTSGNVTYTCTTCGNTYNYTNSNNTNTNTSNPNTNKTLWYKHVRYGNWQLGSSTASNIESKTETQYSTVTCPKSNNTYYTTGWAEINSVPGTSMTYTLKLEDLTGQTLYNYSIISSNYFSSYQDYYTYSVQKANGRMSMVNHTTNYYDSAPSDIYDFMNSSLKNGNFGFIVGSMYKSGDSYYVPITDTFYNGSGVTPKYFDHINGYIYYVPLKFTISYAKDINCIDSIPVHYYRYVDYVWSKNAYEPGYSYTGISEYR